MPDASREPHPRLRLDEHLSTPVRLSLLAALAAGNEADFASLREILEIGDSALSKALSHLERAGYVKVRKGYVGSRPRTWARATTRGRHAFAVHVRALQDIVALSPIEGRDPEKP